MDLERLRKILSEFSKEAKAGRIHAGSSAKEAIELANLAEQFETRLRRAELLKEVRSNTISFSPGACPTCGK
jgi:hypothetical protein